MVSDKMINFVKCHAIEHIKSTALWPQANGEVERQNRSLLKSMKVAHAEGKRWQEELPKFLLAYRSTPQTSAGVTPSFLMFGRELRSKLPELRRSKQIADEESRDRHWQNKLSGKMYADDKRRAKESSILPGYKVLLRNDSMGKLEPKFYNVPYTVKKKCGQEVTVQSEQGNEYQRNSSFVKPYIDPNVDGELEKEISGPVKNLNGSETPMKAPKNYTPSKAKSPRPQRNAKQPIRFRDFVS